MANDPSSLATTPLESSVSLDDEENGPKLGGYTPESELLKPNQAALAPAAPGGPSVAPTPPVEAAATPAAPGAPGAPGALEEEEHVPLPGYESQSKEGTLEEAVVAGVKTFTGGVVRGLPGYYGAKAGAIAGAGAGPWGALTGGVLGFTAGMIAGDSIADLMESQGLVITDPYSLPKHLQPIGIAGEALGMGTGMTMSVMHLATMPSRLPPSLVNNTVSSVLNMAKDRPLAFFAGETYLNAKAAVGEGVFEYYFPGHPLLRSAAGAAAAVLDPGALIVRNRHRVFHGLETFIQRQTKQGRMTQASEILAKFTDGDPEVLIKLLADSDTLAKTIPGFSDIKNGPTVAQLTGDVRLSQLEAAIAEHNRMFSTRASAGANETLTAISNAITLLKLDGSPESLLAIAALKKTRVDNAMDGLMLVAQHKAIQAAEDVGQGLSPADRAAASAEKIYTILDDSIKMAREVETELWQKATAELAGQRVKPQTTLASFAQLKGEISSIGEIPGPINQFTQQVKNASNLLRRVERGLDVDAEGAKITKKAIQEAEFTLSAENFRRVRSDLLGFARDVSRGTGEMAGGMTRAQVARHYGKIADAVLNDIILLGGATRKEAESGIRRGATGKFASSTALDDAMAYTKSFHDTFDRSFVGRLQAEGPYGLRVPPEAILKTLTAGVPDEVMLLRVKELEDAISVLPARDLLSPEKLETVNANVEVLQDAISRTFRIMADRVVHETVDPDTGQAILKTDLKAARSFVKKASQLLDRFPEVKTSLERAISSQENLDAWARNAKGVERELKKTAYSKLLGVESPSQYIRGILSERNQKPVEELDKLIRLAKSKGDEGTRALWAAVSEAMVSNAKTADDTISLRKLADSYFDPIRPDLPSLRDLLVEKGVLPQELASRIDELFGAASRISLAADTVATGENFLPPTSALETLLVRASGSEAGRRALKAIQGGGGGSGGPTLIVAYQAANLAQKVVNQLPSAAVEKVLIDALTGAPLQSQVSGVSKFKAGIIDRLPKFIQDRVGKASKSVVEGLTDIDPTAPYSLFQYLLTKPTQIGKMAQNHNLFYSYLWQAGLLGGQDAIEGVTPPGPDDDDAQGMLPGYTPRKPQ